MIKTPPTTKDLERLYYELEKVGAASIGSYQKWSHKGEISKEKLFAMACEISRYDPRLITILIDFLLNHWKEFNPLEIRLYYTSMKYPQTVLVICEFVKNELNEAEFQFFYDYLTNAVAEVPIQFYFHNLYTPGSNLAKRAVEENLREYKRWGFIARERPQRIFGDKRSLGQMDIESRRNLLRNLLKKDGMLTIQSYLAILGNCISRQQALLDIKNSGMVRKKGKGRGSKWILSKSA